MGTNERSAASIKLRKQQRAFEQDRLSRAIRFEFYLKRLCGVRGRRKTSSIHAASSGTAGAKVAHDERRRSRSVYCDAARHEDRLKQTRAREISSHFDVTWPLGVVRASLRHRMC
jgi:hypothetical protein